MIPWLTFVAPVPAGTVPSSLAALQRLVVLDLSGNQLSGDLMEFAFVALDDRDDLNSRLRSFNASHNKLTGVGGPAPTHQIASDTCLSTRQATWPRAQWELL